MIKTKNQVHLDVTTLLNTLEDQDFKSNTYRLNDDLVRVFYSEKYNDSQHWFRVEETVHTIGGGICKVRHRTNSLKGLKKILTEIESGSSKKMDKELQSRGQEKV